MSLDRDAWLYGNRKSGRRAQAEIRKSAGRLDPASDATHGFLIQDSRITNWGGLTDPSGRVVVISKAAPDPPASRQLRDPFTTFYVQGIALEPPLPPDRLLNLTEENALHASCLKAKADDSCGRGWSFEPMDGKKGDKSLAESEIPERLRQQMEDLTPDLTFGELLWQAAWEMDAIGWSVWEVVRTLGRGWTPGTPAPIGALYPIPAHTVRASLDPRKWVQIRAGRVRFFKKFGAKCEIDNETGAVYEWTKKDAERVGDMDRDRIASEVILFKSYTPRSLWYGLPRWISAVPTIAEMGAIREFNVSWFGSGGQTDYHMHFKANDIGVAKDMVEQVRQQVREFAGRGHTNILTAGTEDTEVSVEKLGELLREGHFRFRRQDLAKEVLIAHNVPPYRVGWSVEGSLGGTAAPEMLNSYKFGAIEPIQNVIEDRLRATLFNPEVGIKTEDFRLTLADLELDDLSRELEEAAKSVESGIRTPNQAREHIGEEPADSTKHPEMDVYYFRGQKLGAEPQPPGGFGGFGSPPPGAVPPGEEDTAPAENQKHVDKVLDIIASFEATLKDALKDDDMSPGRKKSPGVVAVTSAGPAKDDKPNIA